MGGFVAEVEGEQLFVGDLGGLGVEAGVLEGLGAVGEPRDSAMLLIKMHARQSGELHLGLSLPCMLTC